jgi:hypothetical protein
VDTNSRNSKNNNNDKLNSAAASAAAAHVGSYLDELPDFRVTEAYAAQRQLPMAASAPTTAPASLLGELAVTTRHLWLLSHHALKMFKQSIDCI